jgi:outer membrane lipoprotein-sorting protein
MTVRSRAGSAMAGSAERRRVLAMGAALVVVAAILPPARAAEDIWQKSRALYAGLRSYADTGVVVVEYGRGSMDRHTFITSINRAPRRFYFDFNKQGGDRYVIWGDPEAFHTWWKTTGAHDDYPNPNNVGAFSTAGYQTSGSAMKIPALWFSNAGLQGAFTNFADAVLDGTEEVDGRKCHRLTGSTRDVYGATGKETNVRRLTVWIDVESLLVRRVLEVPKDQLPGQRTQTTTTFQPRANPVLDENSFRFVVPVRN